MKRKIEVSLVPLYHQVGKFQTVEGEESINNRLVDLLDKMRLLLQQATISGENTLGTCYFFITNQENRLYAKFYLCL